MRLAGFDVMWQSENAPSGGKGAFRAEEMQLADQKEGDWRILDPQGNPKWKFEFSRIWKRKTGIPNEKVGLPNSFVCCHTADGAVVLGQALFAIRSKYRREK